MAHRLNLKRPLVVPVIVDRSRATTITTRLTNSRWEMATLYSLRNLGVGPHS